MGDGVDRQQIAADPRRLGKIDASELYDQRRQNGKHDPETDGIDQHRCDRDGHGWMIESHQLTFRRNRIDEQVTVVALLAIGNVA